MASKKRFFVKSRKVFFLFIYEIPPYSDAFLLSLTFFPLSISLHKKMSPLATHIHAEKPFIFDLTSDTATIPTDEMFDIMKTATRGDDVYQVSALIEIHPQ
jgi:hypothetical protein